MSKKRGSIPKGSGIGIYTQQHDHHRIATVDVDQLNGQMQATLNAVLNQFESLTGILLLIGQIHQAATDAAQVQSENLRRKMLSNALFTRSSNGLDTLAELNGAFTQFLEDCLETDAALAAQMYERWAPVLNDYAEAINDLREGKDAGEALIKLARIDEITNIIVESKTALRKPGPKGPNPVTQYILLQAAEIKALHHDSDGGVYNALVERLEALPTVRAWIRDGRPGLITNHPKEVQAYDRLVPPSGRRDTQDGGRFLFDLRRHNQEWVNGIINSAT